MQCVPGKKRKHKEMKDVIRKTIQDSLKQLKRESNKERNETVDRQHGESNLWYCLFLWLTQLFIENGFNLLFKLNICLNTLFS